MGLHWDIRNCDQSACWDAEGNMTQTCESMIWATMVVGISHITEKTVSEFAYRLEFDRRLCGTFKSAEDKPVTVASLRPFIGLNTNATTWTRIQFEKKTAKFFSDIFHRETKKEESNVDSVSTV